MKSENRCWSYPNATFFDFESYQGKTRRKQPTPELMIESKHVPISLSIGDTLEREPTHICDAEPKEQIRKFVEEFERRGAKIRAGVRAEFIPGDTNLLPNSSASKSRNGATRSQSSVSTMGSIT